jgi:hypothetical protein
MSIIADLIFCFSFVFPENATAIDSDDGRLKLETDSDGTENAILVIESAVLDDRNTYTCSASNKASTLLNKGDAESKTYVRVKGMTVLFFN